jgi:hypothetical protein
MLFIIVKQIPGVSALRLRFLRMKSHVNSDRKFLRVTTPMSVTVLSNTSCNTRVELPAVTRAVMLLEVIQNILTSKSAAIRFLLAINSKTSLKNYFALSARSTNATSRVTTAPENEEHQTRSAYLQTLGAYMASLDVKSNAVSENFVTFLCRNEEKRTPPKYGRPCISTVQ